MEKNKLTTEEKNKIISVNLNKAVKHLISIDELSATNFQKDIADRLGIKPPNVNGALNGNTRFSTEGFANKFNGIFNNIFNLDWLLTGEGEMLANTTLTIEKIESKGVPYFDDIECTGGILSMYNDMQEKPTFNIDYEHFNDCTAYIPIVGDSMYPQYCSGEIIAVKKINNLDALLWGEAYLVVTNSNANDLRTVKLLFQSDDSTKVILRASNPNYKGDTLISKEDIISLFIIKGKIKRNQL